MPIGDFVNSIPPAIFLLIHLVAFSAGAYFAWRAFRADAGTLGWAFTLFALAEISYMTYHLDWTVFLFAHAQRGARLARLRPRLHRCHQRRDREAPWWRAARDDLAQPDGPCGAGRGAGPDPPAGRVRRCWWSRWRQTRSTCRPRIASSRR